jgi:hypothetical protein
MTGKPSMAGSFGRLHLPTMRLWQRPIALLRTKAAKPSGGKLSTPPLAQLRLDALDKARIPALLAAPVRTCADHAAGPGRPFAAH